MRLAGEMTMRVQEVLTYSVIGLFTPFGEAIQRASVCHLSISATL